MSSNVENGCDFVVVGAGSAGCVVARRLAEVGSVALIEAGEQTRHPHLDRPSEYLKRFATEDDWNFATTRQRHLSGRVLRLPRGRGFGGSTRINASIWMEPTDACLGRLEREGGAGWSRDLLRRAVREVTQRVAPESPRWLSPAAELFLKAAGRVGRENAGLEDSTTSGQRFEPMVHMRMNRRGRRVTAADVWLTDAPSTLVRVAGAQARSVTIANGRATGVLVDTPEGQMKTLRARREVILCGGAVQTPALLLRSGVGPREELRRAGIECRVDVPGVGHGLQDHLIMPVIFGVPERAAFPSTFSPRDLARWQATGGGPVASNLAECGLIAGDPADPLQLHVTPTDYLRHPHASSPAAMTIGVTLSRPRSHGRVWVESADPAQPPQVDPAYLSESLDLERMLEGVALARRIAGTEPLGQWIGPERLPGVGKDSAAALQRSVQRFSQTLYHLAGSCRMGTGSDAVVDPELRVSGVVGLRILDASILSGVPVANPNALITAIAWLAAERFAGGCAD